MIEIFLVTDGSLLIVDHENRIAWWHKAPDSFEAMAARYFYSTGEYPLIKAMKSAKLMEFYE